MARYSAERKSAILKKLSPPHNFSVAEVARQEGISEATLYNWRQKAKEQGVPVPGNKRSSDEWSPEAKFAVVEGGAREKRQTQAELLLATVW